MSKFTRHFNFNPMEFTSQYLNGQLDAFYFEAPDTSAMSLIVVIPCYDEPELPATLNSLAACDNPGEEVGIVVVVNSPVHAQGTVLEQNQRSLNEIVELQHQLPSWLHLFHIEVNQIPEKWAGAGMARKIGFDWAISHFHQHDFQHGILVSLDADTLVSKNYLAAIVRHFRNDEKTVAATLYFEHPVEGDQFEGKVYEAMVFYELYLRYYKHALSYTGFPYALYTLGSAFAVRANAYISMGGMNRRKAGEDFYFLHKMVQFGKIAELNGATVYPSARPSTRVPFGTGPALMKYLLGEQDLLATYPLELFHLLIPLFRSLDRLYEEKGFYQMDRLQVSPRVLEFVNESGLDQEIVQLIANCSTIEVFKKRFFFVFDAFQVLKWLNYCLRNGVEKLPLVQEASKLLSQSGFPEEKIPQDPKLMLRVFRDLDRCQD